MCLTVSFSTNMQLNPADGWTVNITGLTGVVPHTPTEADATADVAQQQLLQGGQWPPLQQLQQEVQLNASYSSHLRPRTLVA